MDVALVVLNMAGLRGSARLACTSRHWRQAAQHWRGCVLRVTFTYADIRRASDIAVCALARDCSALLRIDLAGSQLIGGASINALAASCPLLEEVQPLSEQGEAAERWVMHTSPTGRPYWHNGTRSTWTKPPSFRGIE